MARFLACCLSALRFNGFSDGLLGKRARSAGVKRADWEVRGAVMGPLEACDGGAVVSAVDDKGSPRCDAGTLDGPAAEKSKELHVSDSLRLSV